MAATPITEKEIEKLKATKSVHEWNAVISEIQRARGGHYPDDWWPRVITSELAKQVSANWPKSPAA